MVVFKKYEINGFKIPLLIINLIKLNKTIISIPTQIGCFVGCDFCPSSKQKFERNLTDKELINVINYGINFSKTKNITLSFTGEGEVFLNAKNIQAVICFFDNKKYIKNYRICTSGIKINGF